MSYCAIHEVRTSQEESVIYNYAEVTIRRAELSEVDVIKDIINEAYIPVKKKLSRLPAALTEDLGKISRHIQMGDQYVALVGDTVVGTMRARIRGSVGVIARLAVREAYRSRRIGTMLMSHAENLVESRGGTSMEVEIYGAIEMQLSFYERMGYKETHRMQRMGEEIVVMVKDLIESDEDDEMED
jgi:ribosomal protein S18 acetylase RimI-like enzyme